ncbi:hypothetical protein [Embleya hyalina]|uniref:Uncharacterized protein n=1 Tax=Embleya hyalina TaxID=516124 RepID=A0A401YSK6_9ACTN|nr:hypothetical protein [Embleya hyalina]GCD97556.1 hypothetical protein EHYA_05250 [Embleya hyalina]
MTERGGRVIRVPSERGQLLLVEGGRAGRGRRSDSGGNLVAMSALTPHQLFPDAAADVIQLPDAVQPHAVRAYLQAAGAVDGPVIVYLTGRLLIDRRRRELHLGLRESTPNSVRYDGLPWSWVVELLGPRPAENTLVICDLTAGREAWEAIRERAHELCAGIPLWGVVNPPDVKGPPNPFTRTLVAALGQGFAELPDPVPAEEIHPLLAERARLAPDTVEFAPSAGSLALANCSPEARPPTLRTAVRRLKAVSPRGGSGGTGAAGSGVSALSAVPPNGMTPAQRSGLRGSGVVGGGVVGDGVVEPTHREPSGADATPARQREEPGVGRRALGLVRSALSSGPDDEPEVPGTSLRDALRAGAARPGSPPLRRPAGKDGTPAPNARTGGASSGRSQPRPPADAALLDREPEFPGPATGSTRTGATGVGTHGVGTHGIGTHGTGTHDVTPPGPGTHTPGTTDPSGGLPRRPTTAGTPRTTSLSRPATGVKPQRRRTDPAPHPRPEAPPPPLPPRITVRIQTDAGALTPTPARRPPTTSPTQLPPALAPRRGIGPNRPVSMPVRGRAVGPTPARRALAQGATAAGALVRPADILPTYWNELAAIRHAADTGHGMEAWQKAAELSMHMEKLVGATHPGTLDAQAMLAFVSAGLGRVADAILIYCQVAERGAEAVGPQHPSTIAAADNALKVWLRVTDAREAVRLGPAVVAMRELVPGPAERGLHSARAHLNRMRFIVDPAAAEPRPRPEPRPEAPADPHLEARPEPNPDRRPSTVRGAPVRRRHAKT